MSLFSKISKTLTIFLFAASVSHATTEKQELISKFEDHKKAAEQGDADNQCSLGYYYISNRHGSNHNDLEKACYWFCESAKQKNINALKALGHSAQYPAYFNSYGDMMDFQFMTNPYLKTARDSLQILAEQGDADAQYCLGYCYFYLIDMDNKKAIYWLSKSAEQENAGAQYELGYYYNKWWGAETEKDSQKAFYWFSKSAEHGYFKALNALGSCYEFGIGTEIDVEKAFSWYLKSAEQGCANNQYRMGRYYELCIGTEINFRPLMTSYFDIINPEKAFYWYSKAADQYHDLAQCSLGRCYELGVGTEVDKQKAFYWYQKAAYQNCVAAQYNLSRCYQRGIGTTVDLERAKHWKSEFESTMTFGSEIDY